MEKIEFLNLKKFTDYIKIDENITILYDEKIKSISKRIISIREEIKLYEDLVNLSDEEMKKAKSEDDYKTLVKDKEYFINIYITYKNLQAQFYRELNRLEFKKNKLNEFVSFVNYYNDNLECINTIIGQYNYDFLHNEKSIIDIKGVSKFKENISNIISLGNKYNGINIDINRLKSEYKFILDVEEFYNSGDKVNDKKVDDLSEKNNFEIVEVKSLGVNSNQVVPGDLGYINYCSELCGRKSIKHKIKKIRKSSKWNKIKKSLKKNIGKVIAGVLAGITMIGASTITAGFDLKKNNDDSNNKVVYTMKSVSSNDIISKIEDITVDTKTVETTQQKPINQDIKDDSISEEIKGNNAASVKDEKITIGTKVSASSDIYINATDACNKENSMTPYYPISKKREVSLIYYKNNDGDTVLISEENKDKIDELKKLKYDVVAYCLDDGWYNKDDVKVLVK